VHANFVATLGQKRIFGTVGKSNVSRLWQSVGHKFVDQLRGESLAEQDWVAVMLDGIRLSKDELAIVAIGITPEGHKYVLDFDLGSAEESKLLSVVNARWVGFRLVCDLP